MIVDRFLLHSSTTFPPRITAGGCFILASFFLFLYFQKCFIKRLEYFVQLHSLMGILGLQLSIETLFVICPREICVQIGNKIWRNFGIGCITILEDQFTEFLESGFFFPGNRRCCEFFLTHVFIKIFPFFDTVKMHIGKVDIRRFFGTLHDH